MFFYTDPDHSCYFIIFYIQFIMEKEEILNYLLKLITLSKGFYFNILCFRLIFTKKVICALLIKIYGNCSYAFTIFFYSVSRYGKLKYFC